ncbi:MAG TPA: tyrosine-type recombinase/integrase [Methylosinus sp.]|uniref:tyrosine-type recombinase/integrase n=1 Tax=Methylosinus sp. TaxID=427 RepID=UPI002F9372C6
MFNLAIDSKRRGCDLVRLQVNDICVGDRAVVIQKKAGRPVQFELTEQTRRSVQDWLDCRGAVNRKYLFPSRFTTRPHISSRQYARIVRKWVASAGLDGSTYGTHSMRRTKAAPDMQKARQFARHPTFAGARPTPSWKARSAIIVSGRLQRYVRHRRTLLFQRYRREQLKNEAPFAPCCNLATENGPSPGRRCLDLDSASHPGGRYEKWTSSRSGRRGLPAY